MTAKADRATADKLWRYVVDALANRLGFVDLAAEALSTARAEGRREGQADTERLDWMEQDAACGYRNPTTEECWFELPWPKSMTVRAAIDDARGHAAARSPTDKARLDWLETQSMRVALHENDAGIPDANNATVWSITGHDADGIGSCREALDTAMEASDE